MGRMKKLVQLSNLQMSPKDKHRCRKDLEYWFERFNEVLSSADTHDTYDYSRMLHSHKRRGIVLRDLLRDFCNNTKIKVPLSTYEKIRADLKNLVHEYRTKEGIRGFIMDYRKPKTKVLPPCAPHVLLTFKVKNKRCEYYHKRKSGRLISEELLLSLNNHFRNLGYSVLGVRECSLESKDGKWEDILHFHFAVCMFKDLEVDSGTFKELLGGDTSPASKDLRRLLEPITPPKKDLEKFWLGLCRNHKMTAIPVKGTGYIHYQSLKDIHEMFDGEYVDTSRQDPMDERNIQRYLMKGKFLPWSGMYPSQWLEHDDLENWTVGCRRGGQIFTQDITLPELYRHYKNTRCGSYWVKRTGFYCPSHPLHELLSSRVEPMQLHELLETIKGERIEEIVQKWNRGK